MIEAARFPHTGEHGKPGRQKKVFFPSMPLGVWRGGGEAQRAWVEIMVPKVEGFVRILSSDPDAYQLLDFLSRFSRTTWAYGTGDGLMLFFKHFEKNGARINAMTEESMRDEVMVYDLKAA